MHSKQTQSEVNGILEEMRVLAARNNHVDVDVPLSIVDDKDPKDMTLVMGRWVRAPWKGMMMMLVMSDDDTSSQYVMCETRGYLDLGTHRHLGYVEEIHMIEGVMSDELHDVTLYAGNRIRYPIGEPHWPIFAGPAKFMVIFRKVD